MCGGGNPGPGVGERVTAFIKARQGRTVSPAELRAYLQSRLAPFKVPKEYILLDEIPKSPAGKILKRELKRRFTEGARPS